MKKTLVSFFSIIIVFILTISMLSMPVSAAGTIISFSKSNLVVGDALTVSITMNAGEAMYGVGCIINYDSAKLEFVSGNATGGAGTLTLVESPSGETKVTYSVNFKAISTGTATVSIADCKFETVTESKSFTGASASVKITDKTLSANANLSALSGSAGTLTPKFSQGTTNYTVNVDNTVMEYTVYATAADKSATVNVPTKTKLQIGSNKITVRVTAANGSSKNYTINVVRSEEAVGSEAVTSEPTVDISDDSLAVVKMNNLDYVVLPDLTGVTLLNGFTATTTEYNGKTVAVATDKDQGIDIYYLNCASINETEPYTYDSKTDTFSPLKYIEKNNNIHIYREMPEDMVAPEEYFLTSVSINGQSYKCYTSTNTDLKDFYYIYFYVNGKTGFYRYDDKESTLQRYPELVLSDKEVNVPVQQVRPDKMIDRIKMLSTNAKIIFVAIILAGVSAFAIFILLIVRTMLRNKFAENNSSIDDFDELNLITSDDTEVKNNVTSTEEDE